MSRLSNSSIIESLQKSYLAGIGNQLMTGEMQQTSVSSLTSDLIQSRDLSYTGYDRHHLEQPFELNGYPAHVNRVLFWLASKPNDYIRQSYKGGVLYSLLAQKSSEINLAEWKNEIQNRFNQDFGQDLLLTVLDLSLDSKNKTLTLKMVVQDNITKAMIPVTTGVSL